MSDHIRTKIILTRIEDWEKIALVNGEFISGIRPAHSIMQMVQCIDPNCPVEIEANAILKINPLRLRITLEDESPNNCIIEKQLQSFTVSS